MRMPPFDLRQATALLRSGLGRAQAELIGGIVTPLYWYWQRDSGIGIEVSGGTAFFIDCGAGPFGVTAGHVISGLQKDELNHRVLQCQLGHDLVFRPDDRLIDIDYTIDIATFRIHADELRRLGKSPLTGSQKSWPPAPPHEGRGVLFAGFPARERLFQSRNEISFGLCNIGGIATSVNIRDICSQIEREHLIDSLGLGLMPEDYDMGGMSGGPMLTLIERAGLWSYQLGGVIYAGPNPTAEESIPGFEVVRSRRANFILPSGMIDRGYGN